MQLFLAIFAPNIPFALRIMEPTVSEKRAVLREKYTKAVSNLLEKLDSEPKAAYSIHDLQNLGVTLGSFDPEDLECNSCFVNPMSSKELKKFSLDGTEMDGGAIYYYLEFDKIYDNPTGVENPYPSYIMRARAEQIFYYLDFVFSMSSKKHRKSYDYLQDISGWGNVQ